MKRDQKLQMKDRRTASIVPPLPEKSSPGIRLIQGDALNVLPNIERESVHIVLTDPPYFLHKLDDTWSASKLRQDTSRRAVVKHLPPMMMFDPKAGERLQAFIHAAGKFMLETLKPGGFCLVFSQPRLSHRMATGLEMAGFQIRDMLSWRFTRQAQFKAFSMNHFIRKRGLPEEEKQSMMRRLDGRKTPQLQPEFESIILAQKPRVKNHVDTWLEHGVGLIDASQGLAGKANPTTCITIEKDRGVKHPTVKPLSLMQHLIKVFSKPKDVVLDPFMGSGTTALAAKLTGRGCIGIELESEYMELAKQRLESCFDYSR